MYLIKTMNNNELGKFIPAILVFPSMLVWGVACKNAILWPKHLTFKCSSGRGRVRVVLLLFVYTSAKHSGVSLVSDMTAE